MRLYRVMCIHSSVDGHLGCFQLLAIVNNAAVDTDVTRKFESLLSILLRIYAEVELLRYW